MNRVTQLEELLYNSNIEPCILDLLKKSPLVQSIEFGFVNDEYNEVSYCITLDVGSIYVMYCNKDRLDSYLDIQPNQDKLYKYKELCK